MAEITPDKPKRIQRKRTKGWKMPPNTVYVGRPTKWGNPFTLDNITSLAGNDKEKRGKLVRLFRAWITGKGFTPRNVEKIIGHGVEYPEKDNAIATLQYMIAASVIRKQYVPRLRGKDLACWCSLDQPCHADVLLEIANAEDTQ